MLCWRAIVPCVLLVLVCVGGLPGQRSDGTLYPEVETRVTPTSGTVGDRFHLVISAAAPELDALEVLSFFDAQTTWTQLGDAVISDVARDGRLVREYDFTIVPFETGRIYVPEVAVTYAPAGGTSSTAHSDPLWVQVNSVLSGDGSASALRDVKPPVALSVPPGVVWSLGGLLLLIVAALAWWLWRRYSARVQRMFGRNLTPPELALKRISDLEDEGLIEQKRYKELYTRLTDVVREYVDEAFGVPAMDLTSNELLDAMDRLAESESPLHVDNYRRAVARLVEVLNEADMVKFARFIPSGAQCRRSIQAGKDVVSFTRYRFEAEAESGGDMGSPGGDVTGNRPEVSAGAGVGGA